MKEIGPEDLLILMKRGAKLFNGLPEKYQKCAISKTVYYKNIEFEKSIEESEAREILRHSEGILVVDKKEDEISEKMLKYSGISANKEKLSVIKYKYSDDDLPDFIDVADQLDKIIKKVSS